MGRSSPGGQRLERRLTVGLGAVFIQGARTIDEATRSAAAASTQGEAQDGEGAIRTDRYRRAREGPGGEGGRRSVMGLEHGDEALGRGYGPSEAQARPRMSKPACSESTLPNSRQSSAYQAAVNAGGAPTPGRSWRAAGMGKPGLLETVATITAWR